MSRQVGKNDSDVPKEQVDLMNKNTAEACALACIDFRLVDKTVNQLEQGSSAPFDYTAMPGASLFVIHPGNPDWKTTYLQTLQTSRNLHSIKGVVVVNHENCGAYRLIYPYLIGPDGKIPLPIQKKLAIENMKETKALIRQIHPDIYFRGYFIYLDGTLELVVKGRAMV